MTTILFFDVDSTLVENAFSYKAIGVVLEEIAQGAGCSVDEIAAQMTAENTRRQKETPNHPLTMDWDDIIEGLAKQHGVMLSRPLIDLWTAYALPEDIEVLDNALEVLKHLKQPHRKLVIATKGLRKYQTPLLDVVNLSGLFDDYLTPDVTGYLKTEPEYFHSYTRNSNGTTFIQIGDHYYDDVICARRNGFYSVMRAPIHALNWVDPFERPRLLADHRESIITYPKNGTAILPHAVVISLEELPEVIERIEAKANS